MSALPLLFSPHFLLTIFITFIQTTQYASTVISPLSVNNKWTKCHSLLWLALMTLGIQKLAMYLCVLTIQVLVLKKNCSVKIFFCQIGIQPNITVIFWGTGRSITDFEKQAYEDGVLSFWEIRLGQTEESYLSGKTYIRTR